MKATTAILLAIATLATAAPSADTAVLAARQNGCVNTCTCLYPPSKTTDNDKTYKCCHQANGRVAQRSSSRLTCTNLLGFFAATEFVRCCHPEDTYICSASSSDCPDVPRV